jgi:hypothetical protein
MWQKKIDKNIFFRKKGYCNRIFPFKFYFKKFSEILHTTKTLQ